MRYLSDSSVRVLHNLWKLLEDTLFQRYSGVLRCSTVYALHCENTTARFTGYPEFDGEIWVACDCASKMTDDYENSITDGAQHNGIEAFVVIAAEPAHRPYDGFVQVGFFNGGRFLAELFSVVQTAAAPPDGDFFAFDTPDGSAVFRAAFAAVHHIGERISGVTALPGDREFVGGASLAGSPCHLSLGLIEDLIQALNPTAYRKCRL